MATQEQIRLLVPKERGRSEDDHCLHSEAEEGTQWWPSGTKKTGCSKGWAFERGDLQICLGFNPKPATK